VYIDHITYFNRTTIVTNLTRAYSTIRIPCPGTRLFITCQPTLINGQPHGLSLIKKVYTEETELYECPRPIGRTQGGAREVNCLLYTRIESSHSRYRT
jgi:hypothetical protein